jgi:hypothetical protein
MERLRVCPPTPNHQVPIMPMPMTMPQLRQRIVDTVAGNAINGSHGVSVLDVDGSTVVLIGEVHTNPGLCKEADVDVIRDLVLGPFCQNDGVVLLVEGFVEELLEEPAAMQALIRDTFPDAAQWSSCLAQGEIQCIYEKGRGGMETLRYIKSMTHLSSLTDARARATNSRILFFDVRHVLGMSNPFVQKDSARDHVVPSLQHMGRLPRYMMPIPHERWRRAFHQSVWRPFCQEVDQLRRRPLNQAYKELFVKVPDVVATNHLLATLAARGRGTSSTDLVVMYGGNEHRRGVHRMLLSMSPFLTVTPLAVSEDRSGGSCSRPSSSFA